MTQSVYDILGVKATASPAEIKKAWRRLAQANHPDRGGDPKLFQSIQQAYEVLIDVERRAHYDQTGSDKVSEPVSKEQVLLAEAQQNLGVLLSSLVAAHIDTVQSQPLKSLLVFEIKDRLGKVGRDLALFAKERSALLEVADRFTSKSGASTLSDLARSILSGVDQKIDSASNFRQVCEKMLEIVEQHEYHADLALPVSASTWFSRV